MMGQRRLLMGGTLGFALLASAVIPSELHLTSPCRLEASVRGAVRARAAGQVAELLVREGQRVARGESVGRLSTFGREQKLAELRAQLTAVQAEMTALETQLHGPALAESRVRPGVATTITGGTAAHEERGEPPGFAQGASTVAERRAGATHADLYAVRSRLAEARAAVEAQRRVAARLRADAERTGRRNPPPVVAAARELWHQRTAERDLAQRDLQRLRRLLAGGHVPPQQVDAARSHCETATRLAGEALQGVKATEKSLREAADDAAAELAWRRAALATAQEVTRVEMLTRRAQFVVKQQAAAQLAAQIAVLTDEVQRSTLVAPCDGVVTTSRVEERVGASFAEGGAVLEVADPRALFTRIFVNERDLGAVRVGQPVMLRIAAFPECLYRAQVSEIAPQAVCSGSEAFPTNIVEVHVQLDNPKGQLRPGMSGRAKINCGRCPVGGILLRRLHRYLRTEVWSWL